MNAPHGTGGSAKIGRTVVGSLTNWKAQYNRTERRVELVCDGKFAAIWVKLNVQKLEKGEEVAAVITTAAEPSQRPPMGSYHWTGNVISISDKQLVLHIEKQEKATT